MVRLLLLFIGLLLIEVALLTFQVEQGGSAPPTHSRRRKARPSSDEAALLKEQRRQGGILRAQGRDIDELRLALRRQSELIQLALRMAQDRRELGHAHPEARPPALRSPPKVISVLTPVKIPQGPARPMDPISNHLANIASLRKQLEELRAEIVHAEERSGDAPQAKWGDGDDIRELNARIDKEESRIQKRTEALAALGEKMDPTQLADLKRQIEGQSATVNELTARRDRLTRQWDLRVSHGPGQAGDYQQDLSGLRELRAMEKVVAAQLVAEQLGYERDLHNARSPASDPTSSGRGTSVKDDNPKPEPASP